MVFYYHIKLSVLCRYIRQTILIRVIYRKDKLKTRFLNNFVIIKTKKLPVNDVECLNLNKLNNFFFLWNLFYLSLVLGLLCDLLWSDPDKDVTGWGENDRGVSFTFGTDVVAKFLNRHDLDLICRAHQVNTIHFK